MLNHHFTFLLKAKKKQKKKTKKNLLYFFLTPSPPQTRGEFNGDIWLGFERLTCVPIQTRMVKESMLSKEEKTWLKVCGISIMKRWKGGFNLMNDLFFFFRNITRDAMTRSHRLSKKTNER